MESAELELDVPACTRNHGDHGDHIYADTIRRILRKLDTPLAGLLPSREVFRAEGVPGENVRML